MPNRFPPEATALAVILGTAALASLIVSIATAGSNHNKPKAVARSHAVRAHIVLGPLTGLPTLSTLADRRPMAVIIDNLFPDARPQSGLSAASVVYETPVEAGITRLMAIYLEHDAESIGPIRSARPYFVRWAAGYKALFVHSGGSPAAQNLVKRTTDISDIEALASEPEFKRAKDRNSPDNLYSNTKSLRALATTNGWETKMNFTPMLHKPDAPLSSRGKGAIVLDFSTPSVASPQEYRVRYRYEPKRNRYLRFDGGEPFTDQSTGRQIEVKNVAVLLTNINPIPGDPVGRVEIGAIGHGVAHYFFDGKETNGMWEKTAAGDAIRFLDNQGNDIHFDKGSTWIEVVPPGALHFGPSR